MSERSDDQGGKRPEQERDQDIARGSDEGSARSSGARSPVEGTEDEADRKGAEGKNSDTDGKHGEGAKPSRFNLSAIAVRERSVTLFFLIAIIVAGT